jgi:hypothetical protein
MGWFGGIASYFLRLSLLVSSVALGISLVPSLAWIKIGAKSGISLFQSMIYKSDQFEEIATAVSFYAFSGDIRTRCLYASNVTSGLVGAALALNLAYFHIHAWKKGNLNLRFASSEVSIVARISAFLAILGAVSGEIAAVVYFYNSQCVADLNNNAGQTSF